MTLLAEVEQKQKQRILCNKYMKVNWKNLPKSVRRLWSFLSVNQSYPNSLSKWTVKQTALQFVEKISFLKCYILYVPILIIFFFLGLHFCYQILITMNYFLYHLMNSLKMLYLTLTLIFLKYETILPIIKSIIM